ncbi:MAG: RNA polymerase sigma factor [Planctomycetota bacterium]|jgi:RNA polymerase sigma-70 factor (ECF subfamily)
MRSSDLADEVAQLRAVARGEPAAIDSWYRREHPLVYRLCAGFLADEHEAEDLAQDAMLKLLDQLPKWDERRAWRSWRNTVVLNLCRDRLRRVDARRRAEDALPQHTLPPTLPSPEDAAHAAEVRGLLMHALRSLTPREREAFVAHDLDGASTREAAELLGVTEASLRSLLSLARRRLRTLLGPHVPAPGGAA